MPVSRPAFPVWVVAIAIVAATLAAYQPAWHGGLLWDDDRHLTTPELRPLGGLARIWFDVGATQQYYPVVHSAFWLQQRLWGDSTLGYHLVNILLHAASSVLLLVLLQRLRVPGAPLAALVFALHPVHVESVAWISELKNTLSGVFCLAAAVAYLRPDGERTPRSYAAALALFVAALLSKSVTATLPGVLLVVAWWQRGRLEWRRDVRPLVPFFVLGASAGLLTAWIERTMIGAEGREFALTLVERALVAGRVFWFYLGTLVWPADLTFQYPRWQVSESDVWQYGYLLALLGLVAALWRIRHRWRAPLAACLAFGGTLFPVLGFFNVYPFRFSFVADHFQYLASIPAIALASALAAMLAGRWMPGRRWMTTAAALLVALGLGSLTRAQSAEYADAVTLYRATLARNPASWLAHGNLGALLRASDPDAALAHLTESVRLEPGNLEAHYNLGNVLMQLDRVEDAAASYREAIRREPGFILAHYNLGHALFQLARFEEARRAYDQALRLAPEMAPGHSALSRALLELGLTDDARRAADTAVRLQPGLAVAHYDLAAVLYRQGRATEAAAQLGEALRLDPDVAEARFALGVALLGLGRTAEAEAQVGLGMQLESSEVSALLSQGAAFEALGHHEDARAAYARALDLSPGLAPARRGLARSDASSRRGHSR